MFYGVSTAIYALYLLVVDYTINSTTLPTASTVKSNEKYYILHTLSSAEGCRLELYKTMYQKSKFSIHNHAHESKFVLELDACSFLWGIWSQIGCLEGRSPSLTLRL